MAAYYNEHDAEKAEWLRELIKANVVAPGDVDERSILDVRGDDLRGYTQCHWFAGVGVWSYALRLAGWPDERECWTGSCPCPSFSCAGKGEGFDDPRHLWPAWYRLIRECRPGVVFGEQADAAIGFGWLDVVSSDLEAEEYAVAAVVLGAHSVGAPHRRHRLYFCADTADARRDDTRQHGSGSPPLPARPEQRGGSIERGDSSGPRCEGDGLQPLQRSGQGSRKDSRATGHGPAGERSDTLHPERWPDMQHGRDGLDGHPALTSQPGQRHDSIGAGLQGQFGDVREWRGPGWLDPLTARSVAAAGATRGFWADCDWWFGRDSKWRPIGAGITPLISGAAKSELLTLATGASARVGLVRDPGGAVDEELEETEPETGEARVMRLRGYGDAICSETAAEFIRAYMEARGE